MKLDRYDGLDSNFWVTYVDPYINVVKHHKKLGFHVGFYHYVDQWSSVFSCSNIFSFVVASIWINVL